MSISFSGLASGLDTASLIESLMAQERQPIDRLENVKTYENARLSAYSTFNSGLSSLLINVETLDTQSELLSKSGTVTGEQLVSATTTSDATSGTYQIKSYTMASIEKNVSQGYASKTESLFGTGTLTLTVGTTDPTSYDITIDDTNNSLTGIAEAINTSESGISATIINDGTGTPYRLILTGESAGDPAVVGFSVDTSALTGGTYDVPVFTETQSASQAHIQVDGIDLYSDSNSFSDAIAGVTLTLDKADLGETTANLTISDDTSNLKTKMQTFITSYNTVVSFVTSQSASDTQSAGLMVGDSFLNSVKRRLQDLLTTRITVDGSFHSLAELGLETQRDSTLVLDSTTFDSAVASDIAGVSKLLAGDGTTDGIATRFNDYLTTITDSTDGLLAGRKASINRNLERIDDQIAQMERRLEVRQQTMTDQFTAMEKMVSTLNSQSDYLTQQLDLLSNLWSKK